MLLKLRVRHTKLALASSFAWFVGCAGASDPSTERSTAGTSGVDAPLMPSAGSGGSTSQTGGASGTAAVDTASAGTAPSTGSAGSVEPTAGNGGASAGAANVAGASSGTGGGSANPSGGTGSAGAAPLAAPIRDTASKVPIMRAPNGYTVEGNFAYGPETAQRIDVLYPTGGGPKATQTLPVVLMFHGGAWIHSYNNNSGKDHMTTFSDRYLKHGFIVCNAEYRVNDGSADGAPAPAAVQDALLAAQWCWKYLDYFHGDRSKFVVTGASAGGHLALMVGMTTPAAMLGPTSPTDFEITATISGYGPADIEAELNAVAKSWLPANLPNRAAIAKVVNPISYVRKAVPPLIVVQGENDKTAPVKDSQHLVDLLIQAGADASIHLVPNADHGFTDATWPNAEKAMFDWLSAKGIGK